MQGGLIPSTLPALSFLVGLAFLAEARRFASHAPTPWQTTTPWLYLWLGVSLYIFAQPAIRLVFDPGLTIDGIDISRVYWPQHIEYWSFFTAYWLLAWVVSRQQGISRDLIVIAVIAMALFQSLYGTIAAVNGQETILGIWPKTNSVGSVSGTFYNRNHLAGLLAVSMTLGAAYMMSGRWSVNVQRLATFKAFITVVFLLIAGAALIGTASRAGILIALIGLVVWAWLQVRSQQTPGRWQRLWPAALILIPMLAGLWFGPQGLIERLFQLDQATARWAAWQAMLDVPFNIWLHGTGAGSFHDVFKLIQPVEIANSFWRAHSDYLQLGFEFGLIGIALLAPLLVYWIKQCRPKTLSSLQRGALAGVIAVLIHMTAEFNMQVPGTAIFFWIAVGILFGPTVGGEPSRRFRPNHQSRTPNPQPRAPARRAI